MLGFDNIFLDDGKKHPSRGEHHHVERFQGKRLQTPLAHELRSNFPAQCPNSTKCAWVEFAQTHPHSV